MVERILNPSLRIFYTDSFHDRVMVSSKVREHNFIKSQYTTELSLQLVNIKRDKAFENDT